MTWFRCLASVVEHQGVEPLECELSSGHSGDHNGLDDGGSVWWASGFLPYRRLETVQQPGRPHRSLCASQNVVMNNGVSNCSLHEGHLSMHFDAGRSMYWGDSLTPRPMCRMPDSRYYVCTRFQGHPGLHAYLHEPQMFWDNLGRSYEPGMPMMCQKYRHDMLRCQLRHNHAGDHKNTELGGIWANTGPGAYRSQQPNVKITVVRSRAERKGRRH